MKRKYKPMFIAIGTVAYCVLCWLLPILAVFGYGGLVVCLLAGACIIVYLFYRPKPSRSKQESVDPRADAILLFAQMVIHATQV